ncbi:MAG TPA: hypothetical protein VL996_01985 [Methylocella sp.]|nr:hypothetical protein [Methylocella sp.]
MKRSQAQPEVLKPLSTPPRPFSQPAVVPSVSPWQPIANQPPFNPGAMLLLTDGTLLVQDQGAENSGSTGWWRFAPDINGSYLNGAWSQLASLPAGFAPLYFDTAVLTDGRVIIVGGQYNNGQETSATRGAIYDPLTNQWTLLPPPPASAGSPFDSPGTVLANGTFMIGADDSTHQVLFNAANLSWTITGSGKADINNEENWSLLPNGEVLTVDANNYSNLTNSELYQPLSGGWSSAGSTIVKLDDTNADGSGTNELGPQLLRPDGTVFAAGATGHTSVYSSGTGTWTAGPDFPVIDGLPYDVVDGPAALLPSGKVLIAASPGIYQTPTHFFVFDGALLQQIADTPNAANIGSYYGFMIVLPTGQVMFNSRLGDIELFTETGAAIAANAVPAITVVPTSLVAGKSYLVSGRQLNGVSQGAAYAEGYQPATNYPLIRIVNATTKHVFYARTFGFSGMSVTPGADTSAQFTVPAGIETGNAMLFAVANGIASAPVSVTVARPVGLNPVSITEPK